MSILRIIFDKFVQEKLQKIKYLISPQVSYKIKLLLHKCLWKDYAYLILSHLKLMMTFITDYTLYQLEEKPFIFLISIIRNYPIIRIAEIEYIYYGLQWMSSLDIIHMNGAVVISKWFLWISTVCPWRKCPNIAAEISYYLRLYHSSLT